MSSKWPLPLPSQKRQPGLLQRTMRLNKEPGKTVERSAICWRSCLREAVSWVALSFLSMKISHFEIAFAEVTRHDDTQELLGGAGIPQGIDGFDTEPLGRSGTCPTLTPGGLRRGG